MMPGRGWGLQSGRSREPRQLTLRSPLAVRRTRLARRSVKVQEPRGIMMSSLIEEPQPRRRRDEVMNYFGEKMDSSTSCEVDDLEKVLCMCMRFWLEWPRMLMKSNAHSSMCRVRCGEWPRADFGQSHRGAKLVRLDGAGLALEAHRRKEWRSQRVAV
mmetsp:Transcript_173872/g.551999  ORF Transcript_173872/g.551999 Transcript_173872/m.551999 type:complete len:158 (-) Transcript_173872:216-689(-)